MVAACIFEQTLPLGIDEPPAVLDEFTGVSLSARDGDAGAGKGWRRARAPCATSASGARHPATAAKARGKRPACPANPAVNPAALRAGMEA